MEGGKDRERERERERERDRERENEREREREMPPGSRCGTSGSKKRPFIPLHM